MSVLSATASASQMNPFTCRASDRSTVSIPRGRQLHPESCRPFQRAGTTALPQWTHLIRGPLSPSPALQEGRRRAHRSDSFRWSSPRRGRSRPAGSVDGSTVARAYERHRPRGSGRRPSQCEPPRVYRRVSGSMIRLLFQQRSRFRRMPPLLLAA